MKVSTFNKIIIGIIILFFIFFGFIGFYLFKPVSVIPLTTPVSPISVDIPSSAPLTVSDFFSLVEIYGLIFYFGFIFLIWFFYGRDFNKKDIGYLATIEPEPPEKIDPLFASYFLEGKFPQKTWFLTGVLSLISKKAYLIDKNFPTVFLKRNTDFNFSSLDFYEKAVDDYLKDYFKLDLLDVAQFKLMLSKMENANEMMKYKSISTEIKNHYDNLFYAKSVYFNRKGYDFFRFFLFVYATAFLINGYLFIFFVFIITYLIMHLIIYLSNNSLQTFFGRFTREGTLLHYKFSNYKAYLKNHSNMFEKDIEHVYLWDYHLVYAASFNLTKKINDYVPFVYTEERE